MARAIAGIISGLAGYVRVDLILTPSDPIVVEVKSEAHHRLCRSCRGYALDVASASAAFSALKAERGVLIDIGSTTDLVRVGGGRVQY